MGVRYVLIVEDYKIEIRLDTFRTLDKELALYHHQIRYNNPFS